MMKEKLKTKKSNVIRNIFNIFPSKKPISVRDVTYTLSSVTKNPYQEVIVSFKYNKHRISYFMFLHHENNFKNDDYVKEAKKRFNSALNDGTIKKYIHKYLRSAKVKA